MTVSNIVIKMATATQTPTTAAIAIAIATAAIYYCSWKQWFSWHEQMKTKNERKRKQKRNSRNFLAKSISNESNNITAHKDIQTHKYILSKLSCTHTHTFVRF